MNTSRKSPLFSCASKSFPVWERRIDGRVEGPNAALKSLKSADLNIGRKGDRPSARRHDEGIGGITKRQKVFDLVKVNTDRALAAEGACGATASAHAKKLAPGVTLR
jgi:hypothetical protein